MVKETVVTQKVNHDSMTLTAKFPSGASLKWRIGRGGEHLEVAFSNDTKTLREQTAKINKWLQYRPNENNQMRFDRLEALLKGCKSGAEVIAKIDSNE